MDIVIPIFDRLTALDAIGPYEVLSRLPGATVRFVAAETGPKRTETSMLAVLADYTFDDFPEPEVIVFPGGFGTRMRPRTGRPRCAPVRWCSAPPASSMASRRPRTG